MGRHFLVSVTICAIDNYWYNGFVNLPQVEIVIRTAAVDRDYITSTCSYVQSVVAEPRH